MSDRSKTTAIEVLYCGRRSAKKSGTQREIDFYDFQRLESGDNLTFAFSANLNKILSHKPVGGVYSIEAEAGENGPSYYFSSLKFLRMLEDTSKIVELRALDETFAARKRIEKRMSDLADDDVVERALAPLREAYAKTDYYGRLALEAYLLHRLRR